MTGLGVVTSLGADLTCALEALQRGEQALPIDCEGVWATASASFDARKHFRIPKNLKAADRKTQLALAAVAAALENAGIPQDSRRLADAGVVLGVGPSNMLLEDIARALAPDPERRTVTDIPLFSRRILDNLNPLWSLKVMPGMASAHVAIQLQACGPNDTIMTDWVAGAQAIGEAFDLIRNREVDLVMCGGSDSALSPLTLESLRQAGLFATPQTASPASLEVETESGAIAASEGAGMLVLEEMESAVLREAKIYAEIVSYSSWQAGCSHSPVDSLKQTMEDALRRARWEDERVDVVCPDAYSEPNRSDERRLIRELLPGVTEIVDLKPRLGHSLAASGPVAVCLTLALFAGRRRQAVRVLFNSLGLSGQAVTLCMQL